MRKILFLLTILVDTCLSPAWGQSNDFTYGDATYSITSGYTVTLKRWNTRTSNSVEIPNQAYNINDSRYYSVTSIGDNAFSGYGALQSVTFNDYITTIGSRAFYNCVALLRVITSATSIGSDAFRGCTHLWEVRLNSSNPTSIGSGAFYGCTSLESVTIPNSVTSIGNQAFFGCTNMTQITYNAVACTSVGTNAFPNNTGLQTLTIGSGVTSIPASAFASLSHLTRVNFYATNCTSIGANAFPNCTSPQTLTIGPGVTSIPASAFASLSNLTQVTFNATNCTSIGANAFSNSLQTLTIGSGVESIPTSAFASLSNLTQVNFNAANCTSMGNSGHPVFAGCTNLATVIIGNLVRSIPDFAFYGVGSLANLTIGSRVTSIGNRAFRDCSSLTAITIPEPVVSIGDQAFGVNTGLTSVTFNATHCTSMGSIINNNSTFLGCRSLTTVTIGDQVESIPDNAFYGVENLANLTIGSSVTSIGDNAFNSCSSLTGVSFPASVTSIGNYAFRYCRSLSGVALPAYVTSIGYNAFEGCSSLASITIPESVTRIGTSAFKDCTGLTSVNFNAVNCSSMGSSINNYAFYGCSSLATVTIGDRVESVPSYAFYDRDQLASVTFGSSVASIGQYAFWDCDALASVEFPGSLTTIGDYAFTGCYRLNPVEIPSSVTSIGAWAFSSCSNLQSISFGENSSLTTIGESAFSIFGQIDYLEIPSSVTSIGDNAFSGIRRVKYCGSANGNPWGADVAGCICVDGDFIYSDNTKTVLWGYTGSATSVTIPNGVTAIYNAFAGRSDITSVTIPNSVTNIGYGAFSDCSSLEGVTIPNSVTAIGNAAFVRSGLTGVTIPESVASIGDEAFGSCTSLISVTFNAVACSTMGSRESGRAFLGCSHVGSLTIGSRVTNIPAYAFEGFPIRSVTIPESVVSIGDRAFGYCGSLQSVEFNAVACSTMGDDITPAFYESPNISSVSIGDGVTIIPAYAFFDKDNLQSVSIPNSVVTIGAHAFNSCGGLTSIAIPNSVTTIGEFAFNNCSNIATLTLGDHVESIGQRAFRYCSSLTSIDFPNSVTSIGDYAFQNCSNLESVILGDHVESIGAYAFNGCPRLSSISVPNSVTTIGGDAFSAIRWVLYCGSAEGSPWGASHVGCNYGEGDFIYSDNTKTTLVDYIGTYPSLNVPNMVTTIEANAFSGRQDITSVTIPNSVTTIGEFAFNDCINLATLTLGDQVESIGRQAFYHCGITHLAIPASVRSVGRRAFAYCDHLESVVVEHGCNAEFEPQVFEGVTAPEEGNGYVGFKYLFLEESASISLRSVTDETGSRIEACLFTRVQDCPIYLGTASLVSYYEDPSISFSEVTKKVNYHEYGTGQNKLYYVNETSNSGIRYYGVDEAESYRSSLEYAQGDKILVSELPDNFVIQSNTPNLWYANNIVLTDCQDAFYVGGEVRDGGIHTHHVSYKRDFANGNRSTLYLPFEVDRPDNFDVYEFDRVDNQTLYFTPLADDAPIAAYTPYLVGYNLAKDGSATFTLAKDNVVISNAPAGNGDITSGDWTFKGTLSRTGNLPTNCYGYKDGYFVQSGGSAHVNPFRCYFTNNGSSQAPLSMDVDTDGGYLGIDEAEGNVEQPSIRYSNDVYDLMGRMVRKNAESLRGLPNGIYIWKGKKILYF